MPGRLLLEERELSKLHEGEVVMVLSHRWSRRHERELRLFVRVRSALDQEIELEVRFPAEYPDGCPSVRPVPYNTPISQHQFTRSGILCLELGPDNWHPRFTAADMIQSAWRLVSLEQINEVTPIDIPSRHHETLAERVAGAPHTLLRTQEFEGRVLEAKETVEFEVVWSQRHLTQLVPVSFPNGFALAVHAALERGDLRLPGHLIVLAAGAPDSVPDKPEPFRGFVAEFGGFALTTGLCAAVLRWPDGKTRSYFQLTDRIAKVADVPVYSAQPTRTPSDLHDRLSELRVGIVGLGSLGSKTAVGLARAGVKRFALVDGDVMLAENVCRHACTFADVGVMKVDAVKEMLRDVAASPPEIKTHAINLGSATNPELHGKVLAELATCDVLVDATANPDAFLLLAGLASDHRRPLVWGEVFGGGLGGLIGSAHPADGPCPRCVRDGFLATADAWPPAPNKRAVAAYAGDEEMPLVATDADVSFIASSMTNRLFDVIRREETSRPAVVVLGHRRGWIFETPMQAVLVPVRSDDYYCARCWKPASEADADTIAAAAALLDGQEYADDQAAG